MLQAIGALAEFIKLVDDISTNSTAEAISRRM
jgi:hypothetical protein